RALTPPDVEFAAVSSHTALILALESIATRCKSDMPKPDLAEQRTKIRYLQSVHAASWAGKGAVAEAFAAAWAEADDRKTAIEWYRKALVAEDSGASMKAVEQLLNLRVRLAAEDVDAARRTGDPAKLRALARDRAREARDAIENLEKLVEELSTMERINLCGSAHKRLALILEAAGEADGAAIEAVRRHYAAAEELGAKSPDVFYPALNVIAVDVLARSGRVPAGRFKAVREAIDARLRDDPDFWSAAGDIELMLYEALNAAALAPKLAALESGLEDLHARWPSKLMWSSVRDQARFVLPRYARRRGAPAEEDAALRLLTLLEAYAGDKTEIKPRKGSGARTGQRARGRKS
ncbi:MAG TPA: tetratricopeptide repeat-containing protein, partial [Burkholderiales bacterium]|nr:tetratricopeptide repeat-containing protein [Burkholderiales bacterium]